MESVNVGGVQVALPPNAADLELEDLKTTDGAAIVIRCRRVAAELIAEAYEVLPADSPQVGLEVARAPEPARVARLVARSQGVIEAGSSLLQPDGSVVHPAFGQSAIPFEALSLNDSAQLLMTISKLSGMGSEASGRARFRHDWGGGLENGAGAGRSLPCVPPHSDLVSDVSGADGG